MEHKGEQSNVKDNVTLSKRCLILFLISLTIYLIIILPIRLCKFEFTWNWFVFGLIAIIVFYSFILFNLRMQEGRKVTQKQKININVITVVYISYFWLIDCFYMTVFNNWLIGTFIVGSIILIKIYYSLASAFVKRKESNLVLNISLLLDFLLGIGLTVYLIYLIPDKFNNLQTIVTAIVAAVYGGLLTLVGVAWTIRHGDERKHNDEMEKAKPMFSFNIMVESDPTANNRKVCFVGENTTVSNIKDIMSSDCRGIESYAELENSNNSSFTIKRFYFDGKWHNAFANNTVLPNARILIQLLRLNALEHPIMEIEDVYLRKYYYDLMYIPYTPIQTTLSELKEITESEMNERTQ